MTIGIGITLRVLWYDDDVMHIRVQANNGLFSGTAELYESLDLFTRLAAAIAGFPASGSDSREIQLGTFDPAVAGGGVSLSLRCVDGLGHASLAVHLRSDPRREAGAAEFKIMVEANAIDAFVRELSAAHLKAGATTRLHGLHTFALEATEEAAILSAVAEVEHGETTSATEVLSRIRGK